MQRESVFARFHDDVRPERFPENGDVNESWRHLLKLLDRDVEAAPSYYGIDESHYPPAPHRVTKRMPPRLGGDQEALPMTRDQTLSLRKTQGQEGHILDT